jgi:hypothetical protein
MLQLNCATNRAAVQAQAQRLAAHAAMFAPIVLAVLPMVLVAGTHSRGSLILSPRSWHQGARRLGLIGLLAFPVVGALSALGRDQYPPRYGSLLWGGAILGVMCGMGLAGGRAQPPSWGMTRMDVITPFAAGILTAASAWPYASDFHRSPVRESPQGALTQPEHPDNFGPDLRELAAKCPR